mgnify:CR=1 FL=1
MSLQCNENFGFHYCFNFSLHVLPIILCKSLAVRYCHIFVISYDPNGFAIKNANIVLFLSAPVILDLY